MFSPLPEVNEFDLNSPTTRRLEVVFSKRRRVGSVDEDIAIKLELGARGCKMGGKSPVEDRHREMLHDKVLLELIEKLKVRGIDLKALEGERALRRDQECLEDMLSLADSFRRRADLMLMSSAEGFSAESYSGAITCAPCDMTIAELEYHLSERKVRVSGPRSALIEALEVALLKEAQGMVGDGYEFGRTFVSAEDLLAIEDMNDREMRAEIMARGLRVPRKKADKFELLRKLVEAECEERLRIAFKDELIDEMARRGLVLNPDGNESVAKAKEAQVLVSARDARTLSLGVLFKKYFDSSAWRAEAPEPKAKRGSCSVM